MRSQTPSAPETTQPGAADLSDVRPDGSEVDELDSLMLLINRCVDALHLMQERMSGIEDHARKTDELIARNKAESRADISTLRTRLKLAETSVEQMAIRLTGCEAGAMGASAAQTRDLSVARSDAEAWKKRLEGDLSRINALESRLVAVETGLEQRLEKTEAELAEATTSVVKLRSRAIESESTAAALEKKLAAAGSAIVEQRARIAGLQAKLAAATDSWRMIDSSSGLMDGTMPLGSPVIDLAGLSEDLCFTAA